MLSNEQMKAGRYAKLAKGRRAMRRAAECWAKGGFVRVGTATRYTDYKAKHADLLIMGKSGSLYVKSGKNNLCIDFCSIQFSA